MTIIGHLAKWAQVIKHYTTSFSGNAIMDVNDEKSTPETPVPSGENACTLKIVIDLLTKQSELLCDLKRNLRQRSFEE